MYLFVLLAIALLVIVMLKIYLRQINSRSDDDLRYEEAVAALRRIQQKHIHHQSFHSK